MCASDELDSILQSIGVSPADLTPNPQPTPSPAVEPIKVTISAGPGPALSSGPGAMRSSGPGAMSSGPGFSSGPGNAVMSSGPGMSMSGPGVTYSSGPGMMSSSGPGMSMSGPGVTYSSGPGQAVMSSGPGMMSSSGPGGPVISSGPGAIRSSGPGAMSSGPGAMRSSGPGGPVISAGPGANWARQKAEEDLQPAPPMPTTTPDGRAIVHQGPPCAQCGEMIIGQVVTALSKTYHPDHFVCYHCSQPFIDGKYLINDNQPYCAKDFHDLFSPRCKTCGDIIVDKCINAGGQYFHPNHFCCCTCGTNLKGLKYKIDEESKDIYCLTCMASRVKKIDPIARVCSICKRPIVGEYINLRGQFMHPEHMRCEECGCELTGGNCHEFEGALYCLEHYQQLLRKTCAHCSKPILGRSVTALGRVWHPEHFMCEVCKEPFMGSSYYERDGKAYCDVHFNSLFGHMCDKCGEPIFKNGIDFLDKHYHPEHFMCMVCDKLLTRSNLTEWESKPMCSDCYNKLPGEVRKKFETRKKRERDAQKKRDRDAEKAKKEGLKQSKAAK